MFPLFRRCRNFLSTIFATAPMLWVTPLQAGILAEWMADPGHPHLQKKRVLGVGYVTGRVDSGNTASWEFSSDTPILPGGENEVPVTLYGFLEQTHSQGAENFLVAALDQEGSIKIHTRAADPGETVGLRGAVGFIGNQLANQVSLERLSLLGDVTNNAKGSSVLYRALVKSGDRWYLSEMAHPGTTGEKDFILGSTQWAEWDPTVTPTLTIPTVFPVSTSSIGQPEFLGIFFHGECIGSGIGLLINRLVVETGP